MSRLDPKEVEAFLVGQTLHAFDPDSHNKVASVTYQDDGTCVAIMKDGTEDRGHYGVDEGIYWTRYNQFRGGETHHFYLVRVGPQVAQAYHSDGRRAFLQSPLARLDPQSP